MNYFKPILFFVIIQCSFFASARQVTVKGTARSYAGEVLSIYTYQDLISKKETELAKCTVDTDGNFIFRFEIKQTLMAFVHLNVFKGIIFLEPNKEYEIVLPQKVNKLPEDELNPFFEEQEFFIRILNQSELELNHLIGKFNHEYDQRFDKYFRQYFGKLSKAVVDTMIDEIERLFVSADNLFFKDYKTYTFHTLRSMAYERNNERIIESAFTSKPVLYNNPAYMELFNKLFNNYLSYFSKTDSGRMVPQYLIKHKSLQLLRNALSKNKYLEDKNLQDIILSKSLYDNYYKDDFPHEAIVFVMDSLRKAAFSEENRTIAQNLYERITSLMPGYFAPVFELPDKSGKMYDLSKSKGKFVYLNFINPKSYTALQELEVLKKMSSRNFEMLEIITICVSRTIDEMNKLLKDNSYNWKFLYYSTNFDLLKKYNIRAYPTYYLINPEGRMAMSPAFPPTEASFEARYFDMLRAWKREMQIRKSKGLQN
jgi:peroxiredoxin